MITRRARQAEGVTEMAKAPCEPAQRGFTLIEVIVTIVVMAVALLAVANGLQLSTRYSADTLWQTQSVELMHAYMEEIQTRRYDELTPNGGIPPCAPCTVSGALGSEAGEVRSGGVNSFNDVDDYHGLDEQPPRDAQGVARADYPGYRVQVAVTYSATDFGCGLPASQNGKQITLTITPPGQKALLFSAYRCNF